MKKTFTLFICICISVTSFGQKQVTLEDIWLNYKFYPNGVSGFKSMNDGKHYTTTEKGDDVIKIYKNSFQNLIINITLFFQTNYGIYKQSFFEIY